MKSIIKHPFRTLLWMLIDFFKGDQNPLAQNRSPLWAKCRKKHLKTNKTCAVCGGQDILRVHHIIPFHIAPDLELEPSNLITLCERKKYGVSCHLWFGHLGNWKNYNENVVNDSFNWHDKRIKANSRPKQTLS